MQKIRIIVYFFENSLHWQSEDLLLLFTVCTVLDAITGNFKARYFCRIFDKFTRMIKPIRITSVRISGVPLYITELNLILHSPQALSVKGL